MLCMYFCNLSLSLSLCLPSVIIQMSVRLKTCRRIKYERYRVQVSSGPHYTSCGTVQILLHGPLSFNSSPCVFVSCNHDDHDGAAESSHVTDGKGTWVIWCGYPTVWSSLGKWMKWCVYVYVWSQLACMDTGVRVGRMASSLSWLMCLLSFPLYYLLLFHFLLHFLLFPLHFLFLHLLFLLLS